MNVINIGQEAFFDLYYKLAAEIREQLAAKPRDKWLSGKEAMEMLRITSRTTLQKLRDEGKIRYSQPEPKMILYDRDSIDAYIEKHVKDTF